MRSPLLANIALHGMEEALGIEYDARVGHRGTRALVRYADDFVVFCESKADAERSIETLKEWLAVRGLTLSADKTRIVQLAQGFDFLGFNIRSYPQRGDRTKDIRLTKPSKDAVQRHRDKLRDEWDRHKGQPVAAVVAHLSPKIRGWANYYRRVVATATFKSLDYWMFRRECRYVNFTHPRRSRTWQHNRYWGALNKGRKDNWVFGDKRTGAYLPKYVWTTIERHVKVRGTASPDDPCLREYWEERARAKAKDLIPSYQKIARHQNHICPICGETLVNDEDLHKDHIRPRNSGKVGIESYDNYQLLHRDCHKQKTAVEQTKREPTRKWLRQWLA